MAADEIRVTVDGRTYTISSGLHTLIRARRDHARGFKRGRNAPGYVRVLTALRNQVAECLGVDRRTASQILRQIRHT